MFLGVWQFLGWNAAAIGAVLPRNWNPLTWKTWKLHLSMLHLVPGLSQPEKQGCPTNMRPRGYPLVNQSTVKACFSAAKVLEILQVGFQTDVGSQTSQRIRKLMELDYIKHHQIIRPWSLLGPSLVENTSPQFMARQQVVSLARALKLLAELQSESSARKIWIGPKKAPKVLISPAKMWIWPKNCRGSTSNNGDKPSGMMEIEMIYLDAFDQDLTCMMVKWIGASISPDSSCPLESLPEHQIVPWHLHNTSNGVEIRQLLLPSLHFLWSMCNELHFCFKSFFFVCVCVCVFSPRGLQYFPISWLFVVFSSRNNVGQVEVGLLWSSAAAGLQGHGDLSQGALKERTGLGKISKAHRSQCLLMYLKCLSVYIYICEILWKKLWKTWKTICVIAVL